MYRRVLIGLGSATIAGFLIAQLIPYRVSNPPVIEEPAWDSAQTEALARRACYDCHSNETEVPWYAQIAPISWVIRDHVDEGRQVLNFSEMNRSFEEAHEAGEEVMEAEMPPPYYALLHPEAQLSDTERLALARGLDATLGGEGEHELATLGHRHEEEEGEEDDD